jgi:two-component system chemotaxis response regulator CheY
MALNVLVTDDSAVMRAMIIKTLRLSGLPLGDIHQAANGAEGLEALDSNWIDLALVDINMPVMDGEEMIDRLRRNPDTSDLPVVVVSTESSETRINLLERKGAIFVHKPFTPEALRKTIMQMTGVTDEQTAGGSAVRDSGTDF